MVQIQQQTDNTLAKRSGKSERMIEVLVFLLLIVPSMVLSFFIVKQGTIGFVVVSVSTMLRDIALVSLILFFLWRNKEPFSNIGWKVRRIWREIGIGILLFFPVSWGSGLLDSLLQVIGFSSPATPEPSFLSANGYLEIVLGIFLVIVVAVAEETIFRGYLILRFQNLTGNSLAAVLLSAFVFSLGHGYEGTAGVITVGVMGLAFAIVYLWRQSLVAPMVMHFLQDFIGIVLIPLLHSR